MDLDYQLLIIFIEEKNIKNKKKVNMTKTNNFILKGIFKNQDIPKDVIKKNNIITEFIEKKEAFIYLGSKEEYSVSSLRKTIKSIFNNNHRGFTIDIKTFISNKITIKEVTKFMVEDIEYLKEVVWNKKTKENKKIESIIFKNEDKETLKDSLINIKSINWVRNLQQMPANVLHSIKFAQIVKNEFEVNHKNIFIKILEKSKIKELGMNLLLSVNAGSKHEARVVVLEYKGDPSSKEKTVMVGKGITFDAGGYDIKINSGLIGMKYDMSGAAIVAGAMKIISHKKPKTNISAVMVITDNKLSLNSITPDSVIKSMDGKTVEISDTDAEGRLVLADGLSYAIKELNATKLIDVATLTGSVVYQLGSIYTGIWTTSNEDFNIINKVSISQGEDLWRMPFNDAYSKGIKSSDVADLMNYSSKVKQDSQQAAMFLKEFTDKKPFVHLDVAGTADINGKPTGVMVKTLGNLFV
ncbi:MAG: leucyl aminopeptidase family protein [Mycoplasma sp.]|nr:leucyl aminopeptidase family protein [Mycoplasma sp.]